jgi:hypothetical protein
VDAFVFEAELVEYPDVSRRLAVRGDQTLADLHQELRRAFEWWDDDEYSFGVDSSVQLQRLRLRTGEEIAYVFDSSDEWPVRLRVTEIRPAGDERFPVTLERRGKAPPQYLVPYDEELGAGD